MNLCPQCGQPVDGQRQICAACLLEQAMESQTVPATTAPMLSPEELAGKFPQFEILECLGRGGMGVVYKARQKSLNRLVAIKLLAPEREQDPRFAARFAREAELLAKLSHPHIVTIHDFGETEGLYYLVMEFVDGVNLREVLRDGKLDPEQAIAIVPDICEALQFAHEQGIVHRDIKPENILMDRLGRVKVADFGIAKLMGEATEDLAQQAANPTFTEAGKAIGTPAYMAPEQKNLTHQVDHRADIYALGVVFYQMLTGELPGKSLEPPSRKVQIDVRLDQVVLRALERQPERRYATAADFRTGIEEAAAGPSTRPMFPRFVFVEPKENGGYAMNWFGIGIFYLVCAGLTLFAANLIAVLMKRESLSTSESLFYSLLCPFGATVVLVWAERQRLRAKEDPEQAKLAAQRDAGWVEKLWLLVALAAVLLAFFNPWGDRAWSVFAMVCAALGALSGVLSSHGAKTKGSFLKVVGVVLFVVLVSAGASFVYHSLRTRKPAVADVNSASVVRGVPAVENPVPPSAPPLPVKTPIRIYVNKNGEFELKGRVLVAEALREHLTSVATQNPLRPVIVYTSPLAPYAEVKQLLDACAAARLANLSFSKDEMPAVVEMNVTVLGAVRNPGNWKIAENGSLLDALAAAGGWTETADLKKIKVLFPSTSQASEISGLYNLPLILEGNAVAPELEDRAVITVELRK